MANRADNLEALIRLSKKINRGIAYHDAWHTKFPQRESKYKNKDRETIRHWDADEQHNTDICERSM